MACGDQRIDALLRQQAALAKFGELAIRGEDLDHILTEACRLVGEALGTDLAKVMELQPDGETLKVRAGVGWRPGIVGKVSIRVEKASSEGYALETGEPVASRDIEHEDRFQYADFIRAHGVKALVNVAIIGPEPERPFGLLQVDAKEPRDFGEAEIDFLRGYANLLAGVVERLRAQAEARQAQTAIQGSEALLRSLIEGIPQLVWRADAEGNWIWGSPQWRNYTGFDVEQSQGAGWLEAVHPADRPAAQQAWSIARERGALEADFRLMDAETGAYHWFQTRATPRYEGGKVLEWLGTCTDVDDLRQFEARQNVLVAELQHRTRNLLAVVHSIAQRTIGKGGSLDSFYGRLSALGRVQGLLSQAGGENVDLGDLIRLELAAYSWGPTPDVQIDGQCVSLPAEQVQTVALAIHELATNAMKYGALKHASGRLSITWKTQESHDLGQVLVLDWVERGVPIPEGGPTRKGYGRELIERSLRFTLKAITDLCFTPEGVRFHLELPLSRRALAARPV